MLHFVAFVFHVEKHIFNIKKVRFFYVKIALLINFCEIFIVIESTAYAYG